MSLGSLDQFHLRTIATAVIGTVTPDNALFISANDIQNFGSASVGMAYQQKKDDAVNNIKA
ncbi:hypothetical protein [uncultured Acinetobacter sp.]|uniref:hypothetical protein n=1 Tax=uncultured Acinetobacter sp. TaxID=165433 RepID=UPI003748CDDB